MPLPLLG
ncbi:hypothetical protein VCHC06A1_0653, partial [Vibrio cholerae HC-06A1]